MRVRAEPLSQEQGCSQEAESLMKQAATIARATLGIEHPLTQKILKNSVILLAHLYTNGDVKALLQRLAQK